MLFNMFGGMLCQILSDLGCNFVFDISVKRRAQIRESARRRGNYNSSNFFRANQFL